jgi:hypothetical protein
MRRNRVDNSVVSALTDAPASRSCGLETTPPMSPLPTAIAAASFCGWAHAEPVPRADNRQHPH